MRRLHTVARRVFLTCAAGGFVGCYPATKSFLDERLPPPNREPVVKARGPAAQSGPATGIERVSFQAPAASDLVAAKAAPEPLDVDAWVRFAVERNPRIARATIAIDAAQGRYIQAGLYPNPDLSVTWDEIGDRTGNGILMVPKITQTIVTGKKLTLSQVVAAREVDQTTLDLVTERYSVVANVRAAFYEAYTLQRRAEVLAELVKLSEEAAANGKVLFENKQIARLDLVQLEVERERFRADAQAVAKELPAAYRRLAAVAGDNSLPVPSVFGTFDGLPAYDLEQTRAIVLATHPEVRAAKVGVDRAQAAIRRAEVEPIPNVSVYGGFIRQYENKSYDGAAGLSMPVPVWNRNQGNIRAAKAELGMAIQAVGRVENDLATRVATAFQTYAAARERAERYRTEILPRATETYKLSMEAFKGGQFEYLRVLQAQRAIAEAKLELNRALGEAWRSAAELSGLLLEESWPGPRP